EPGVLGRHLAHLGQAKTEDGKPENDAEVDDVFQDRLAQRLGALRKQAVDEESAVEQRKAEKVVSERQQRAVRQKLPPRPPSVGECLAHHEAAAAEHDDGQYDKRNRHRPALVLIALTRARLRDRQRALPDWREVRALVLTA